MNNTDSAKTPLPKKNKKNNNRGWKQSQPIYNTPTFSIHYELLKDRCAINKITVDILYIQYTCVVGKYIIYFSQLQRQVEIDPSASISSLFRSDCKSIAISKIPKQLPTFLKTPETRVVLIVFIGVICNVSAYTVTVSFCRST